MPKMSTSALPQVTIEQHGLYQELSPQETRIFRVLEIEPFRVLLLTGRLLDWEDGVEEVCGLTVPELGDVAGYTAISYTWGDETNPVDISIENGFGIKETRKVTRSLVSAVRELSKHAEYLWTDQISIDQKSLTEKGHQIALMKDIYEHAAKVCVWLGEGFDGQELAVSIIHQHVDAYITACNSRFQAGLGVPDLEFVPRRFGHLIKRLTEADWQALEGYFCVAWFERAWIRQEATAKEDAEVTVHRGSSSVSLMKLQTFAYMMKFLEPRSSNPFERVVADRSHHLLTMHQFYCNRRRRLPAPLLGLLNNLRRSLAKDPRDKVYCLLSFASDVEKPGSLLQPDYSLDYPALCVRLVVWFVRTYRTLDFLSFASRSHPAPMLPEWCPDWRQGEGDSILHRVSVQYDYASEPIFYASGPGSALAHILVPTTFKLDMLCAEGIFLGKIREVSSRVASSWMREIPPAWVAWAGEDICPLNNMSRRTILRHTAGGDCLERELHDGTGCFFTPGHAIGLGLPLPVVEESMLSYASSNRRLFYLTSAGRGGRGLLGLCPGNAQVGDEIWVLRGGRMLHALRCESADHEATAKALDLTGAPHHDKEFGIGDESRSYIGECFIKGLMEGQVLDMIGDQPNRQRPECLQDMGQVFEKIYIR